MEIAKGHRRDLSGQEFLNSVRHRGRKLDMASLIAAIRVFSNSQQQSLISAFLRLVRQQGLQPSILVYNIAIGACKNGQKWELASQLLNEVYCEHLNPDVITINTCTGVLLRVWGVCMLCVTIVKHKSKQVATHS
jgi:hypothetical protein